MTKTSVKKGHNLFLTGILHLCLIFLPATIAAQGGTETDDISSGVGFHDERLVECLRAIGAVVGEDGPTCFIAHCNTGEQEYILEEQNRIARYLNKMKIKTQYDVLGALGPGDSIDRFMENGIKKSNFVLLMFTRLGKQRVIEDDTSYYATEVRLVIERLRNSDTSDFLIPLLMDGDYLSSVPTQLSGKLYIEAINPETGKFDSALFWRQMWPVFEERIFRDHPRLEDIRKILKTPSTPERELFEAMREIESGYNSIQQSIMGQNIREIVLIIGDTGAGKSTIANYLAGNTLIVRRTDKGLVLEPQEALNGPVNLLKVGHDDSTTEIPNNWYDSTTQTLFFDCPGFGDTRKFPQDIINAFYVNELFNTSREFKLLFVFSEASIQEKGKNIRSALDFLSGLFSGLLRGGREADLKNCISCVFTKQRDVENPFPVLSRFGDISEFSRMFLGLLAGIPEKLSVFPHPSVFDPPLKNGDVVPDIYTGRIRENIAKSELLNGFIPNIVVSEKSLNRLTELENAIGEKMTSFIADAVVTRIQDYCDDLVTGKTLQIAELKQKFGEMENSLKTQNIVTASDLITALNAFENMYQINIDLLEINKYGVYVNFIQRIKQQAFSFQTDFWKDKINGVRDKVKLLSGPQEKEEQQDQIEVDRYKEKFENWDVVKRVAGVVVERIPRWAVRKVLVNKKRPVTTFQLTNGEQFAYEGSWEETSRGEEDIWTGIEPDRHGYGHLRTK